MAMNILFLAGYFFPAIVAGLRRHHNETAIAFANLVFGWTIIGWLLVMVWALTQKRI